MASQREPPSEESPEPDEGHLDDQERMVLCGVDRDAFLDALSAPPEPTDKLRALLRRHSDVLGTRPEDTLA